MCGILSDTIQKKLLTESHDLTVARAQKIVLGMEAAEKSSKEVQGPGTVASEGLNFSSMTRCYHCGRRHAEKECKFKDASITSVARKVTLCLFASLVLPNHKILLAFITRLGNLKFKREGLLVVQGTQPQISLMLLSLQKWVCLLLGTRYLTLLSQ